MAPNAPALPIRFPCWCKAVYSWGGETKRDLGFIEGDLIECLNAGDGSWWMGRLRRDKRMVGLFPSNFVQILDESFQPESRSPSPMPSMNGGSISRATSPNPAAATPSTNKAKSVFRKPFQAYYKAPQPNPEAAARDLLNKNGGLSPHLTPSNSLNKPQRPYSSMRKSANGGQIPSPAPKASGISQFRAVSPAPQPKHSYSRAASPLPNGRNAHSRAASPLPYERQAYSRAASPLPPDHHFDLSRATSPAPPVRYPSRSQANSPNPYAEQESSPPPPPPPHRVAYQPSRAPSPAPNSSCGHQNGYHTPEPPSPMPTSPNRGFTPSPLTNAMNDVMSSLQDMSTSRRSPVLQTPPKPAGIWSPEAFDRVYKDSARKLRPQTSQGIGVPEIDDDDDANMVGGPPQIGDYVRRMESRLRKLQQEESDQQSRRFMPQEGPDIAPAAPPKTDEYHARPQSSVDGRGEIWGRRKSLRSRKSAYELGKEVLGRTFTTKSSATTSTAPSTTTQSSTSTQLTSRSIMSGHSAGAFSATSAGSLARKKWALGNNRPMSVMESRAPGFGDRPETPFTGVTYHSSHASQPDGGTQAEWSDSGVGLLGGLTIPRQKKSGFFKKIIESAKTGAATARSTISSGQSSRPVSRQSKLLPSGMQGVSGPSRPTSRAATDMGLGGAVDWVQIRRDVNRSNSLSKNERNERAERCQMMDLVVLNPVDLLYDTAEGDEGLDGLAVTEPIDFTTSNLSLVDKSARFINSLPPMTTPASLAQGYVCRPYRSDVQRLRAIFTWVSERVSWEEDFEGDIDSRRVIQTKRGCAEEIALLVMEMCASVGIHAEIVRGYLKTPGEVLDLDMVARPNHWWNTVIVEGEWRIMDCSLASPTNPKRSQYSSAGAQVAEGWWFLARPVEICYTHVPLLPEQQHIVPPIAHEILMALPCACPPFFRNSLQLVDFDTSLLNLDNLELAHLHVSVPEDVECVAEVESRAYAHDADGDLFESGDVVRKRALAQPEWVNGQKRYTIKALLPGDEGHATLKIYAGKRGLMHSIKSIPHSLAFAVPLTHTGQNPPYDFLTLHPTPHAQRHDLYVAQPQCARLAVNNTFVFAVRQHPSSLSAPATSPALGANNPRSASPNPFARPTSAMSMASAITSSAYSNPSSNPSATSSSSSSSGPPGPGGQKPAKLAVQSPSGKIIRMMRKSDHTVSASEGGDGGCWETVIKIGEAGTWRGLVLADRSARWCVFAEWECR